MTAPTTEFRNLIKARNTLIKVVTTEERRVERALTRVAAEEGYLVRAWDCASGALDALALTRTPIDIGQPDGNPGTVIEAIKNSTAREVWILRDLDPWMAADYRLVRAMKTLARDLEDVESKSIWRIVVLLSASPESPEDLRPSVATLDWPLPTREELGPILEYATEASKIAPPANGDREAIINAATGLTANDAYSTFLRSIVEHRRVDPAVVVREKKQIIGRERLLEWWDADPRGLSAIGGHRRLVRWFEERADSITPEALEYGLSALRGVLLCGPPGVGKSALAKAVATLYRVPLVRIDMAALKGGTVGTSEQNIRRVFRTIEAMAPVCVWADEIDQAMAGATSEWTGDSGVSKDQLGYLLTWTQEHKGFCPLLATTNNPERLPPELLRKGRFDAIFFCDLPTRRDRAEILGISIRALPVPRDPEQFDLDAVAAVTDGFSGAELAALPSTALFTAFSSGVKGQRREPTTDDLLRAAAETIPVSRSASERIAKLRAWAQARAIPASDPEEIIARPASEFGRVLALEEVS